MRRRRCEAKADSPLPKAAIETVVTRRWLTRHPRWSFHFTPISCSWLNAVETLFAELAKRQLKRGVFPSVVALQEAINHSVAAHNRDPKPFVWKPIPKPSLPPPKEGTKRQIRSN
jgi:transposase